MRTDAEVSQLQDAVDEMVQKAVKDPQVPRELVASLASWSGTLNNLRPR